MLNSDAPPFVCLKIEGVFVFCRRNTRNDAKKRMGEILYKEESYKTIGACFEVYKQKGAAFTEPIYQECLHIELEMQGIPFVAQPKLEYERFANTHGRKMRQNIYERKAASEDERF